MRYYQSFRTAIPLFGAGQPRVTHPFATKIILLLSPFDLHVLSTPPAFILSQDQTLRNNFVTFSGVSYGLALLETTGHRLFLPITLQLLRFCVSKGQILLAFTFSCQGVSIILPMTFCFTSSAGFGTFTRDFQPIWLSTICFESEISSTHLGLKFYSLSFSLSRDFGELS